MGFTCDNELEISGGSDEERRGAAALALALDSIDEDGLYRGERDASIALRFRSVDALPEEGIAAIAGRFPALSFTLVYYSRDGGFFGYAKTGASGEASESEDIVEDPEAIAAVLGRFGGDGIAFARDRYSLVSSVHRSSPQR